MDLFKTAPPIYNPWASLRILCTQTRGHYPPRGMRDQNESQSWIFAYLSIFVIMFLLLLSIVPYKLPPHCTWSTMNPADPYPIAQSQGQAFWPWLMIYHPPPGCMHVEWEKEGEIPLSIEDDEIDPDRRLKDWHQVGIFQCTHCLFKLIKFC